MVKKSGLAKSVTPFYVIFTDLDGTLLDHDTYEWKEAEPALDLCKKLGVPVVFVSSKTRAEIEVLRRQDGHFASLYLRERWRYFFSR